MRKALALLSLLLFLGGGSFHLWQVEIEVSSDWAALLFDGVEVVACKLLAPEAPPFFVECTKNMIRIGRNQALHRLKLQLVLENREGERIRITSWKGSIGYLCFRIKAASFLTLYEACNLIKKGGKNERIFEIDKKKILPPPAPPVAGTRLAKLYLAFYYLWYGTPYGPAGRWLHWNEMGHNPDSFVNGRRDIASAHYPLLGPYDSADPKVIEKHIAWAKEAGLDGFICSWFGPGSYSDRALKVFKQVAERKNFPFSIYFETEALNQLGCYGVEENLRYILQTFARSPAFLRLQGKPLLFLYASELVDYTCWRRCLASLRQEGFRFIIVANDRNLLLQDLFDGLHHYMPPIHNLQELQCHYRWLQSAARQRALLDGRLRKNKLLFLSLSPGLEKPDQPPVARNRLILKESSLALRLHPDGLLITSFNEWHEGTEIEPSVEFGKLYLRYCSRIASFFKAPFPFNFLR